MNSIRINHICPSFNNKIYQFLVEEQMKQGDEIRVFYFTQKNTGLPNGDKEYVDGTSPFTMVDRFFFFIKESKVLNIYNKLYDDSCYDIVHAHTLFTAGYIAYKRKQQKGTPYVVAVRGTDVNLFFKRRAYLRKVGLKILKNADWVVFISPAHMREVMNKYIPKNIVNDIEKKSSVIPNGIDDFWHLNECSHIQPMNNNLKLIYYGDIDRNKNINLTIEACELLMKKGFHIEYKIIGKVINKKVKKIINSKDYIIYIDFSPKEEIIKHLRESDIFVMPSFSETFGLTYVEAMSQGVPVIYTEGQGFDTIFEEGQVGYHVNPYDPICLADRIIDILNNYSTISENCVNEARKFSWKDIVKEYKVLYSNIIEN